MNFDTEKFVKSFLGAIEMVKQSEKAKQGRRPPGPAECIIIDELKGERDPDEEWE
jgi:hypothetical protein